MNNDDITDEEELQQFFSEWKEKDKQLPIPPLELKKTRQVTIWKWLPMGVAAVLLLGFWFVLPNSSSRELEKDLVIIKLIENSNQEQEFIIETTSTIDVWEAPSSSLLTEF